MAKVHPNPSASTCSSLSEKETFTIWMKSLVCHGNGCTVFDSDGDVAFRVDNYQQRCSSKAFLMDSTGNILFSLNRKVICRHSSRFRLLICILLICEFVLRHLIFGFFAEIGVWKLGGIQMDRFSRENGETVHSSKAKWRDFEKG